MVILVDKNDDAIGQISKFEAHSTGLLHRAFSIFVINSQGEILMQKRSLNKYHTPGLWSNTCCSHPKPGEKTIDAANRRLSEEMGLTVNLNFLFKFHYYAELDNKLTENEIDHIFIGYSDELPNINQQEVMDFKFMSIHEISKELKNKPESYTIWCKLIFEKLINQYNFFPIT